MTSSKVAAPTSSHHVFTASMCSCSPWIVSQSRRPGTPSGTSTAKAAASSAVRSASLSAGSSSVSSTKLSPQASRATGCKPRPRNAAGTKNLPLSVKRTRHSKLRAPRPAALPATSRSSTSSAWGPNSKQSWPTQNSTLATPPGPRPQIAKAEPLSMPTMASTCMEPKSEAPSGAGASPTSAFGDATPKVARSSLAVASSAPLSERNSSKSTSAPGFSAAHLRKTTKPCNCLVIIGRVMTELLSRAAPVWVKPSDLPVLNCRQRFAKTKAMSRFPVRSSTL
mmetsp:Transcript_67495/g.217958  ORF Transcript_67495/g.217958 Transcript_67495/m.217958 type:complete len:281 (+) Transcript_67495:187-1029(+)